MKTLNLYCGIGGNRKLWGEDHEITAVELDETVAAVYRDYFPNDTVIVGDDHQYLLDHYKEFDFIWSSPPCPTHSRARFWGFGSGKMEALYPDMKLYQEVLFLRHYFSGKWVIENVDPFYTPLDHNYVKRGRHLFWSNFAIGQFDAIDADINRGLQKDWQDLHGFDISGYKFHQRKDKILRNCVHPKTGKYILDCAMNIMTKENINQLDIFDMIQDKK